MPTLTLMTRRAVRTLICLTSLNLCACQWTGDLLGLGEPEPVPAEAVGTDATQPADQTVPGVAHELLLRLEGTWKTESKLWPVPDLPPTNWSGTCRNWLVLGGRFLVSEHDALSMAGDHMEALGFLGHDNLEQRYVSTWGDTFSTALQPVGRGRLDRDGEVLTVIARLRDPENGQLIIQRDVTTILSGNEYRFERFEKRQGLRERRLLEILLRRAGSEGP